MDLNTSASFTWGWNDQWFLKDEDGKNFVWSDPDYGGDNTIKPYNGTFESWMKEICIPYGRDKGMHTIKEYCGSDVKFE